MGWLDASDLLLIESLEAERAEDLARSAHLARTTQRFSGSTVRCGELSPSVGWRFSSVTRPVALSIAYELISPLSPWDA